MRRHIVGAFLMGTGGVYAEWVHDWAGRVGGVGPGDIGANCDAVDMVRRVAWAELPHGGINLARYHGAGFQELIRRNNA